MNEPVKLYDAFNAPNTLGLWNELRLRPNLLNKALQNAYTVRREAERYNQLQEDIEARNQNGFAYFYWKFDDHFDDDEPPLPPSYQTRIIPSEMQKSILLTRCNRMRDYL